MTATLAELEQRIADLEAKVEAGEEALSPGVYSINAKGEVEAKISGTLEAAGITFKELTARPNPTGEILWLNAEGKARELIAGTRSGVHHSLIGFTQPTAATFANFTLEAAEDNSSALAQLQATRESEVGRLTFQLSATEQSAALQVGESLSGLEVQTALGLTVVTITAGGVAKQLLTSTSVSDWMLFPGGGSAGMILKWLGARTASWGLLTNANVSATAAIEESKLSLPNLITLGTEQTITGKKTFTAFTTFGEISAEEATIKRLVAKSVAPSELLEVAALMTLPYKNPEPTKIGEEELKAALFLKKGKAAAWRIQATPVAGSKVPGVGMEDLVKKAIEEQPANGTLLILTNTGANPIFLQNENANSEPQYRFLFSGGADIQLNANHTIVLLYDLKPQRWRDISVR